MQSEKLVKQYELYQQPLPYWKPNLNRGIKLTAVMAGRIVETKFCL